MIGGSAHEFPVGKVNSSLNLETIHLENLDCLDFRRISLHLLHLPLESGAESTPPIACSQAL